jgi:transposase
MLPKRTKLHAVCDSHGRPLSLFVTAGPASDYNEARALLSGLPKSSRCSGIEATMRAGSEMP